MEGRNLFGNVATTSGSRTAAAADEAQLQKKRQQRNKHMQTWRMKKRMQSLQKGEAVMWYSHKRVMSMVNEQRASASTFEDKDCKRARRDSSSNDADSEPDLPRRSPRKHKGSNSSQPKITSPPWSIVDLSSDVLTSPTAESTPKTTINRGLESRVEEMIETTCQSMVGQISSAFEEGMAKLNSAVQSLAAAVNELKQQVDQLNTSSVANSSVNSVVPAAVLPRSAIVAPRSDLDGLTAEQRSILCRVPVVSTDKQQSELDKELKNSGRDGVFFGVLVRTLADRVMNKSDANKTANSALRALYNESYLAERVTMAGYRQSRLTSSGRDYGEPGKRFVALGRSLVYWAVFEAIKLACRSKTTDDKIQKAIREGVSTLRLHDKERRRQLSRQADNDDDADQ